MTYLKLKELTEEFNWEKKEEQIHKKFDFKSFDLAVDFFNLVVPVNKLQDRRGNRHQLPLN